MGAILADLTEQEKRGEMDAFIHIVKTDAGTTFGVNGEFSENLRFAGYTMIKALHTLAEKLANGMDSTYTPDGPIRHEWPAVRRPAKAVPRRFEEITGFGRI